MTHKFKIGDKVRRFKGGVNAGLQQGETFTIRHINSGDNGFCDGHDPDNLELVTITPSIQVGDKYKFKNISSSHVLTVEGVGKTDVWFKSNNGVNSWAPLDTFNTSFDKIIPEQWKRLSYKNNLKNSVEVSSETFTSEADARARVGSDNLFAGVAKLENN